MDDHELYLISENTFLNDTYARRQINNICVTGHAKNEWFIYFQIGNERAILSDYREKYPKRFTSLKAAVTKIIVHLRYTELFSIQPPK